MPDESETIPVMSKNSHIRHKDGRRGVIVRVWADDFYTVDFGHYTQRVPACELELDR